MKKYILLTLIVLSVNITYAQDFFDALRYSQTEYGGTARSIAMGSAFGALGGDFVSASINPAGLGFYRSSEFTLSPTLNINQMESNYLSNSESDNKYNFNFNNISYVATAKTGNQTGILSFSFGLGYNRLKNFNSNTVIKGFGATSTLLNYFTDYANSINDPNSFDYHYEGMAWNTYLIDEDQNATEDIYFNDLTTEDGNILSHTNRSVISTTGHLDEYLLAMGANINHKVYIGASVGFVDMEYHNNISYTEIDDEDQSEYLNNFNLQTDLDETGMGVNFKLGIIFRPTKALRLGAAFHTPTFYSISKNEYKYLNANYDQEIEGSNNFNDENEQTYDYRLETPFKANFSAAYSIGNAALVSVDYELVNYSGTKFRHSNDDNYDYSDQNSVISNYFSSSNNLRIGGEYRVTPNFSARLGYNLMGNPWNDSYEQEDGTSLDIVNKDDSYSSYSAGFGYRQNNFFIDFAYRMTKYEYETAVHQSLRTDGSNLSSMTSTNNQATITFGFRF